MVDWMSVEVLNASSFIFDQMVVFMLGIYGWDYILSFVHMEFALVTGRLKFRWPLLFYLFGRYAWLGELVTMVVITHKRAVLNCPIAFRVISILATVSVACASSNLLLRTAAIWRENIYVLAFLVLISIAHWATAIVVGLAKSNAYWNPLGYTCVFYYNTTELIVFYTLTVFVDLSILMLTIIGLFRHRALASSALWTKVRSQGVLYFVVTLVANIPVMIFAALNLNPIMTVMMSIPAATLSIIVSSRAVLSLLRMKEDTQNAATGSETASGRGGPIMRDNKWSGALQFTTNIHLTGITRNSTDLDDIAIRIPTLDIKSSHGDPSSSGSNAH